MQIFMQLNAIESTATYVQSHVLVMTLHDILETLTVLMQHFATFFNKPAC